MNLKLVSADWTGVHGYARQDVIYAGGQVTMAPDWDPAPICGGGIHYAEGPNDYMPYSILGRRLIEVEPVGETVRVDDDKTKSRGIRVVREIVKVPTPAEEPDVRIRKWIAERIPADKLDHLPAPEEEPDADVRRWVARRIPIDQLDRVPTPEKEPDALVRRQVAWRIHAGRLDHLPAFAEEPDVEVRAWVARRIPTDKLDHLLTPEEEPEAWVRWGVAYRIQNKS